MTEGGVATTAGAPGWGGDDGRRGGDTTAGGVASTAGRVATTGGGVAAAKAGVATNVQRVAMWRPRGARPE